MARDSPAIFWRLETISIPSFFLSFFLAKSVISVCVGSVMKYYNLLTALGLATMNATAGTSAPAYTPPAPTPEPALCEWFIGGTYGQLTDVDSNFDNDIGDLDIDDLDLDMFSLHVGRGITNSNGWDFSAYLEVAYLYGDTNLSEVFDDGEDLVTFETDVDLDIIPVTLNFKVEHPIFGPVSAYLSGGVGYAWTKFEAGDYSHDDGGFYAQAAGGLVWNISESFEVYGGARWLHLDDIDVAEDPGLSFDDAVAWEVGVRFNF